METSRYSAFMHLRKQKKPNGRIYLSIVQSYRSCEGKPRSKTIRSLGYLDELEKEYPDPVAHFQQEIDRANEERESKVRYTVTAKAGSQASYAENHGDVTSTSHALFSQFKIPFGAGRTVEAGAAIVLASLHRGLGLSRVLAPCAPLVARPSRLTRTVELLVWNRIAHPHDLAGAWESRAQIPGMKTLTFDEVLDALNALGTGCPKCRGRTDDTLQTSPPRNGNHDDRAFCLVINIYIENSVARDAACAARWAERPNPIVQCAIMTDATGAPLDYSVFDASLATPLSSFPAVYELSQRHPNTKLVIVSDKTVGADGGEIGQILDSGHGFMLLQSLRKSTRALQEWVISPEGYAAISSEDVQCKQRMGIRTVEAIGSRRTTSIAIKEIALWQRTDFETAQFNRYRIIRRNEDIFTTGLLPNSGERLTRAFGEYGIPGNHAVTRSDSQLRLVYWNRISADETMDGYRSIVTSELDLSEAAIVELYQNLQAMRVFFAPAVGEWGRYAGHISRPNYIQAHFFICYLAARVTQQLFLQAGKRYPNESVRATLARLTGHEIAHGLYHFDYRSRLSDRLASMAGIDLARPLMTSVELTRLMQNARKA